MKLPHWLSGSFSASHSDSRRQRRGRIARSRTESSPRDLRLCQTDHLEDRTLLATGIIELIAGGSSIVPNVATANPGFSALDGAGNLYVSDTKLRRVVKYAADDTVSMSYGWLK